jgi:1,4-alpha-glucan branching enzyme
MSRQRILAHAEHFADLVENTLAKGAPDGGGILCAAYDTELFGHWWFEGPEFIYAAIRSLSRRSDIVRITCGEYLDTHSVMPPRAVLQEGSWGAGGHHAVWSNSSNAWIWPRIWRAEAAMKRLAQRHAGDRRYKRLLAQAARELLLMSSSDWPFLMTTGSARDYAEARFNNHSAQFEIIASLIDSIARGGQLTASNKKALTECEQVDRIYDRINVGVFANPDVNP